MSKAKSFFTDKRTIISAASAIIIAAMLLTVFFDPLCFSAESLYGQLLGTADKTEAGYDFDNTDKTESTPVVDETPEENDEYISSDSDVNTDTDIPETNTETDDTVLTVEEGDDAKNFAFVNEDNIIQFALLSSSKLGTDSEEKKIIDNLINTIRAKYDGLILKSDQFEGEADAKEIIVGRTTREESQKALDDIQKNRKNNAADYIIRMEGKKLIINAVDDSALADAVDYFIENFIDSGVKKVSKTYKRIYKPALQNITIAGKSISDFTVVTPRDSSYFYTRHTLELCDFVRIKTGIRINETDSRAAETQNEILVGNTGRLGTPAAPDGNRFIVKQSGSKVCLVGNHINTIDGAVEHLLNMLKEKMAVPAGYSIEQNYTPSQGDYQLVWNDEFDSSSLDESVWSKRTLRRTTQQFGNYTNVRPENVSVRDGNLIITGKKEADNVYSTGEVHTGDTLEYVYGYIEIRAKLAVGQGVWTNFWLQNRKGSKAFFEIDIFEKFPGSDTRIDSTLHTWWWDKDIEGKDVAGHWYVTGEEKHSGYSLTNGENFGDAYHTYGCEWTSEVVSFFVDGKKTYEYPIGIKDNVIFHTPVSVVLDMYLGEYGVKMDESVLTNPQKPLEYKIDYIHLYQKPGVGLLNFQKK